MNEQETIEDIIKGIRAEADYIEETARGSLKAGENYDGIAFTESDLESALDLAETKRKEADRLEAALKREMSKNTSKNGADFGQLGDCAKLRKALRKINSLCGIGVVEISSFEIGSICDAALAAPPRNCDMQYNDRAEMFSAFKDWCNARGHTMEPKLAYDAFEWLLAPATEQEGGL